MTEHDINIDELFAKRDISGLIKALKSKDNTTRYSAASAISKLGPDAAEAMPALIELLKHWDAMTRVAAAGAIGKIGITCKKEVQIAVPALQEALKDRECMVRRVAGTALEDIDPALWVDWDEDEDSDTSADSL
ncbi:MAG: HEAT repeat domain-containing protein [Dehalococcoidia bacterium]|jgi:HEAT repeat protein